MKYEGENELIFLQPMVRKQDLEEIKMFYWFSVRCVQKYKLKSIKELIKKI